MGIRVTATIDRKALRHNLSVARRHAPQSKVLAIIKANAYGHGLVSCAEALQDAELFGVTDIDEAEQLRKAGSRHEIVIMQGLIDASDARRIADGGFQLIVHRAQDLRWLELAFSQHRPARPLTVWLKLDTGMGRLGITPAELPALHLALRRQPWVGDVVLLTHLANAATPDHALNSQQILQFARACQPLVDFTPETSIAASAALLGLDCSGDIVRPGIMLYGSSPFAWHDAARRRDHFDLKAAMTLQAGLISIQQHQAGDSIGYNSQFICPTAMTVGIVSVGYADGYPSITPNGCPVLINGQRTGTLGRVSMDMLAIDLTGIEAQLGDLVTLWGESLSIDEVAAHIGMISYNLLANLNPRVRRDYR